MLEEFSYTRSIALLMKFYSGLTPDKIMNLTWREFFIYLQQIPILMKMFKGIDPTSDEEVKDLFKQKGII